MAKPTGYTGRMRVPFGAPQISRALTALTYAGPSVPTTSAAGIVARLRKATAWSAPYLSALTGLAESAARVSAAPTRIVDRHGAITIAARLVDDYTRTLTPTQGVACFKLLSVLAETATGIWDPRSCERVLVAPNVLEDAHRYSLDQGDWSKWVALRAGLWGVALDAAPFIASFDPGDEEPLAGLLERMLLVDCLVSAQLDQLTPADIASVGWLKAHRHYSAVATLVSLTARASSLPVPDHVLRSGDAFARYIVAKGLGSALLSEASNLPTPDELDSPQRWRTRVA